MTTVGTAVVTLITAGGMLLAYVLGLTWEHRVRPPQSKLIPSPSVLFINVFSGLEFLAALAFQAGGWEMDDHIVSLGGVLAVVVLTTHTHTLFHQWKKRRRVEDPQ